MGRDYRFVGPKRLWSTAEEAARFLGLEESHFQAEVLAFPHLLPRHRISGVYRWHAHALLAYALARPLLGDSPTREQLRGQKKGEENSAGEKS